MMLTTLALSLAAAVAPAQAISPAAETLSLTGCHPYASKTPACRIKANKAKQGKAQASAPVCHPDPTKSRSCDARSLRQEETTRVARADSTKSEAAGGE